jgi:hypothetical protein
MNSFIQSCVRGAIKGMLRLIGGLLLVILIIVGMIWLMTRPRPQWQIDAAAAHAPTPALPSQTAQAPITAPEFQALIADVYHVTSSQFVRPDLLHVTFKDNETGLRGKCQGIANLYSFRSGQPNIFVECWANGTRIGFGSVQNGALANP